jgi:SAM-dependent methyltransferase
MSIDRSKRITFEEVADLYDETRLGYPEALVDDIISLSGIPDNGRILEVGCGPGNATLPFARRGYRITAIELGARLAELARHNCRDFPNVEIIHSSFEDWGGSVPKNTQESRPYDLAISAEAFHWIPPEIGYPRLARALKPGGSAALFWNAPVDPHTGWSRAIEQVYQDVASGLDNPDKAFDAAWLVGVVSENFARSGCFGPLTVGKYPWSATLTTQHYLKLLRTYSSHRGMDEAVRQRLYAGIRQVLERFGGQVTKPQMTVLFFAHIR